MLTMEVERLIERCRQGDAEALGELYSTYARRMRGVCRRYVGDEQTVDDVLHDAFVVIFTSFDRLRDARKAESWMMAIARNVASKYREQRERLALVPIEEAATTAEPAEAPSVRGVPLEELLRMVDGLPEGYGKVFRLSVFEGMTHKEIAAALGIEPHSSSSQLARAKRMLRKLIAGYGVVAMLLIVPVLLLTLWREKRSARPIPERPSPESPSNPAPQPLPQGRGAVASASAKSAESPTSPSKPISPQAPSRPVPLPLPQGREAVTFATSITFDSISIYSPPFGEKPGPGLEEPRDDSAWTTTLACSGVPSAGTSVVDNFMTMPSLTGLATRSVRIYNWADYTNYAIENAGKMDSVDATNMNRVALANAQNPWEPISETKHHERPRTWQLSLSKQLSNRWSLTTGLGYTYMKSTFEAGNDRTLIRRTQRLHYVDLPLSLTYRIAGDKRWAVYASGGIELDIPVSGRLTTQYLYNGTYPSENGDSLVVPTSHNSISAPWQWSVSAGVGLQYQLLPHVNVYFEPRLQYFIPTGDNAPETYRTEHPFDLTLPLGIRFTW